ncbi:MAG TPA: transketolase C-terminal domain-containing protein [Myxococcales bacterium]|nr:transketolase C-terminal domain-containing protein [Myxococcales bacterium]
MSTMVQAIRMALHVAEERHQLTDVFGEDVGPPLGGAFTATQGIKCAWNSPLDERGIVGAAIGLGLAGCRNVGEIQFCDYAYNTIDLLKLAGLQTWSTNGGWNCPMTIMTPVGSGIRGSIYHSHSFDATATHIPGFKIAIPSTPRDAYGLLLSCIVDPNPCFFLVPKALMRVRTQPGEEIPGEPGDERALSKLIDAPLGDRAKWQPQWPDTPDIFIPFGEARTVRRGRDLTVVSYARTLPLCKKAADELSQEGIEAEVIDLRSLHPVDWPRIEESVRRTGRALFVNEDTEITNFGEHLLRRTVEELFYELLAPPRLLAGAFVPGVGLADELEMASVPQLPSIRDAMRQLAHQHA